jgi:Effector-associated domain 7
MLDKHFNMEELRTLCFDLDVDFDNLRGEGKTGKARELVVFLDSHDRIHEIVEIGSKLWPGVPWGELPGTPEQEQVKFENISSGQRPAVIPPAAEAKDTPKD